MLEVKVAQLVAVRRLEEKCGGERVRPHVQRVKIEWRVELENGASDGRYLAANRVEAVVGRRAKVVTYLRIVGATDATSRRRGEWVAIATGGAAAPLVRLDEAEAAHRVQVGGGLAAARVVAFAQVLFDLELQVFERKRAYGLLDRA